MTEKRFKIKYINEQHISANLYDDKTFIGSIVIGEELIVELLNSLNDENAKLQARNKYLATKIQRERNSTQKQYAKWEKEAETKIKELLEENKQLKTTISRLIEQNRKNNDLLISDIRLLEKALWCPNCTININRLRELRKEFEK